MKVAIGRHKTCHHKKRGETDEEGDPVQRPRDRLRTPKVQHQLRRHGANRQNGPGDQQKDQETQKFEEPLAA